MKAGFIGLGTMGAFMAQHLMEHGECDLVLVHDVRKEAGAAHVAAGAVWADSPGELAEQADVVFTSLPGPAEIEAVALGEQGLLHTMRPETAWFDMSTGSPTLIRRLHADFLARGIQVLDAPVSGAPIGAQTRRLAIWVGGDQAT